MESLSTVTIMKAMNNALTMNLAMSNAGVNLHFIRSTTKIESFSVHCSAKSNTDRGNATDGDNNFTGEPSSRNQEQEVSGDSSKKSSSFSSSTCSSSFTRGLIFDLGTKDSWDSGEIGCPVVKRYISDDEERWYMWYYGRRRRRSNSNSKKNPVVMVGDSDSIGLAISSNGIHWERGTDSAKSSTDVGLVMNCSSDWWAFDKQGIRPSEIVIMSSAKVRVNNSLYWLYYTGYDNNTNSEIRVLDKIHKSSSSLPGLAMSQDGRHWARIEGGEHYSGALFDVGKEGEWDSSFIASPQVVFHGIGDLRMYYHSFDIEKGKFCIGIARSRDGIKWFKLGKIDGLGFDDDDENGVMNARVVRDRKDGKYVMAYECKNGIGMAISEDGLKNWIRFGNGCPVLEKSSCEEGIGRWDCEGVGSPCLVQMEEERNGEWRLYYRGIGKHGKTGIGMAVSNGSGICNQFQRWTGFHL